MPERRFKLHTRVTTRPDVKPKRYASRTGVVACYGYHTNELGVKFPSPDHYVWFVPEELVAA